MDPVAADKTCSKWFQFIIPETHNLIPTFLGKLLYISENAESTNSAVRSKGTTNTNELNHCIVYSSQNLSEFTSRDTIDVANVWFCQSGKSVKFPH